ncbi:MAG TPA: undecaprenyl-diphosphatase UppP [Candidatus Woesebacteria bacterium]|nr:undecaprenyl-diphosphatase UppP [Candidatus Woesebacteria bacterium]
MDFLDVIILSIVEGITEFLPISSTGHLILTAKLLGIPQTEFVKTFTIVIQLGAILAALVLYGKMLVKNKMIFSKVAVAFFPSAIIGFIFYRIIKDILIGNEWVTVVALLLGGIALIIIELRLGKEKGSKYTLKTLSMRDALFIGLFQTVSIIPGISRAAATILGGLILGMNRRSAVEFSFLLAIPTMIAASGYDMLQSADTFSQQNFLHLGLGMVISFVVALTAMRWLLKFIQTNTFIPFGIYRIAIALIFMLILLF